MKPKNKALQHLGFIALALAFASNAAHAASDTWSGATSTVWDTATSNWLTDGTDTLFNSGNDALFTGSPANNVTTATGLTIGAITLDNMFTGSVTMSGANTVNGATAISGGTLNLNNATGLGTSAVTVNSGGTFAINAGSVTVANNFSGAGIINTTLPSAANSLTLSGDLSGFTGTLNVGIGSGGGKLVLSNASTAPSSSATINVATNGTLFLFNPLNYGSSLILNGGTTGEALGQLRIEGGANWTGGITLKANSSVGINFGTATISGNIGENGGSFGFNKQGNGTTVISGNNTYSGTTTISGGTLSVGHNNALGTGSVAFNGGTLANTTGVTLANNLSTTSGVANINASGGTMVLNGNITGANGVNLTATNKITLAGTNSFATTSANSFANLKINAGAGGVDITGSTTVGTGSASNTNGYLDISGTTTVTVQSGGSLTVNGSAGNPGSIVGQNATGTSTVTVNGGSLTIGGNTGIAFGNNRTDAIGVLTISSGTATINRGSTTATDQRSFIALGRDGGTGIINLNGGVLATDRNFVRDGSGNSTPGTSTANFVFGGGTLKALANQTDWLNSALINTNQQALSSVTTTAVSTIDANGFNVGINNNISGAGGFTIDSSTGTGTVTLGGTNTYNGATAVTSGTLALSGSISSSSALALGGGTLSYTKAAGNTQTFASTAVNAGISTVTNATATNTVNLAAITRSGNCLLNISSLTGTTTTSNAVDSTGILGTWFSTGTGTSLTYAAGGSSSAITAYTGTAVADATGVTSTTGAVNYDVAAVGALGAGASFNTLRYTGAAGSITGDFTANGLMNAGTGAVTYSGNVTIGANKELVILGNTQGTTLDGVISDNIGGASSITYGGTGAGTLALNGANTYTGATTVNAGTLKAGAASVANTSGAFGNNSAVTMANASGATLDITGFNTQIGSLAGGGTAGGNVTLGAATLTIGGDDTSTSYAGVISGASGSLTKIGIGTQTLSGANSYTGATNVNAGTLLVSGSIGDSAVTVANNATLASGTTGTIGNSVSVSSGGKLAAGGVGAIGTATVGSGGLALSSGSIFEWDLNGATGSLPTADQGSYDKVVSNGTMSGTSIFNVVLGTSDFTDTFWNSTHTWSDIFTVAGVPPNLSDIFTTFSGTGVNTDGSVTGQGGFSFNGGTTLTWSAVPEPTSAMAGLLLGAGLLRRRRKN